MAETYTPRTPGLFEAIAEIAPHRVDEFRDMLIDWRRQCRSILHTGGPRALSVREQLSRENELLEDRGEHRPWTEIENAFLREKASFWTDKQMARELVGRSENAVRNHRYQCGIRGRRGL